MTSQAVRFPWVNRSIFFFVAVGLVSASPRVSAQSAPARLAFRQTVERTIGSQDVHGYQLQAGSGQFFRVVVEQQGVDVVVLVLDPTGKRVARVDRPNSVNGPESVSVIADIAGEYVVEVRTLQRFTVRAPYTITLTDLRPVASGDSQRIDAERAVGEGEELRSRGSADTASLAIERFSQAIDLWRELHESYEEAVARYGRAWSYQMLGDYHNAIGDFRQACSQMSFLHDRNGEVLARSSLAWTYLYVGENEQAKEHFLHALSLHQSLRNPRGEAVVLSGLGWASAFTARPVQALGYFQRTLDLRRKTEDRRGEVLALSAIGLVYNNLGQAAKALDHLEQARNLSRTLDDAQVQANPLAKLGWVHLTQGHLAEAGEYFGQALRICQATGDRSGEADILYGLASVEMRRNCLDQALQHIDASLNIIESLRGRNSNLQLRSAYLALVQDHYQLYMELLMRLHRARPMNGYDAAALQISERARARGLLDALAEAQIDLRERVDARLIAEERRLQQKLNDLSARQMRLLHDRSAEASLPLIESDIRSTIGELEETRTRIKIASPRYFALTQPQPATVEQIQYELLDEDTLLLEYALGDERSYLFRVSSADLQVFPLPARAQIEPSAQRLQELLSARSIVRQGETAAQRQERIARADDELRALAADLSRMLLPTSAQLGSKRLLIVVQGNLQLLPFAVLPDLAAQEEGSQRAVPLLMHHELINLPSASTLVALRREAEGRRAPSKLLALMADPVFEKSDARVRLAAMRPFQARTGDARSRLPRPGDAERNVGKSTENQNRFSRLTSTEWEAEQITRLTPADQTLKAVSFAANRELVTSGLLADYRFVHFATHSYIHPTQPELSSIVLSQVSEQGRTQNGFLRLHEIHNLKLAADLVVLSACRTGMGAEIQGEGLMSLARGFLFAGARRVLVSGWPVQDRASAALMVKFYRHLLSPEHPSPAAALRAAQIDMLQNSQWTHPYFWAGFTLQGEWK